MGITKPLAKATVATFAALIAAAAASVATSATAAAPDQNCIQQYLATTRPGVPPGGNTALMNAYYHNEARQYCQFRKDENKVEYSSQYGEKKDMAGQ